MDQNGTLASMLRMVGMQRQQQQGAAPPAPAAVAGANTKGAMGSTPGTPANLMNGQTRQAYLDYTIDAQSNGTQPLPYAQWAQMQVKQ
jgi:hypothetical protein